MTVTVVFANPKTGIEKTFTAGDVNDDTTLHWQREIQQLKLRLRARSHLFVKLNAEKSILLLESLGERAKTNYRNRERLQARIMKKKLNVRSCSSY